MRCTALAIGLAALGLLAAGCGGPQTREYRIHSWAMEPTLHCPKLVMGCRGNAEYHVVVQVGKPVGRGDIIAVTHGPSFARMLCGERGVLVERIVGLPRESVT